MFVVIVKVFIYASWFYVGFGWLYHKKVPVGALTVLGLLRAFVGFAVWWFFPQSLRNHSSLEVLTAIGFTISPLLWLASYPVMKRVLMSPSIMASVEEMVAPAFHNIVLWIVGGSLISLLGNVLIIGLELSHVNIC